MAMAIVEFHKIVVGNGIRISHGVPGCLLITIQIRHS